MMISPTTASTSPASAASANPVGNATTPTGFHQLMATLHSAAPPAAAPSRPQAPAAATANAAANTPAHA